MRWDFGSTLTLATMALQQHPELRIDIQAIVDNWPAARGEPPTVRATQDRLRWLRKTFMGPPASSSVPSTPAAQRSTAINDASSKKRKAQADPKDDEKNVISGGNVRNAIAATAGGNSTAFKKRLSGAAKVETSGKRESSLTSKRQKLVDSRSKFGPWANLAQPYEIEMIGIRHSRRPAAAPVMVEESDDEGLGEDESDNEEYCSSSPTRRVSKGRKERHNTIHRRIKAVTSKQVLASIGSSPSPSNADVKDDKDDATIGDDKESDNEGDDSASCGESAKIKVEKATVKTSAAKEKGKGKDAFKTPSTTPTKSPTKVAVAAAGRTSTTTLRVKAKAKKAIKTE